MSPVAAGMAPTVKVFVTISDPGTLYVITVDPVDIAVITPVLASIVATAGFELEKVPPGVALEKVVVPPTITLSVPVKGATSGTVIESSSLLHDAISKPKDIAKAK